MVHIAHLPWAITNHLWSGSISDTGIVFGQSVRALSFFFFSSAFLSVQSSRHELTGGCHFPSDREPSQKSNIPFFSLWAVSPFGGKLPARQLFCVTLPRVHPAFQQRVPWHGATYPAVEALIPFLSPTRLSFRLLWSSSGKIANILFLLWAKIFPSWRLFLLHRWHILFSPLHLMASTYIHSSPQPRRHSVK